MEGTTIFDKILNKEIPADIVYEDENVLAFNDINPAAPVHVLVIPKQKISGFDGLDNLSAEFTGVYMQTIAKIAGQLKLDQGYRIIFNNGTDAGQEVPYIHAHILGGRKMTWPPG